MRIILEFRIIFGRKNRYVVTVLLCQLPNKVSSISAVKMQTGFEFWWIHHYFQYFIYMQEPQKIGKLNAKQIRDFPFISISIVDDLDWTREKKKRVHASPILQHRSTVPSKPFSRFQMKHFVQIIMSLHSFHFYRLNFFSFLDCFNALNDDGVCLSFPYRKQNRQTNQQTNKSNRYIDVCICAIRTLNCQCQSDLERNVKMAIFMHHLCMWHCAQWHFDLLKIVWCATGDVCTNWHYAQSHLTDQTIQ